MKTKVLQIATVLLGLTLGFCSYGQQNETVWVTINDLTILPTEVDGALRSSDSKFQQLIFDNNITSIEQAVPSSKQSHLQKVYELSCNCDASSLILDIERNTPNLINPEVGPTYSLLNNPNDYSLAVTNDWALNMINASDAWNYSTGDLGTIIGISDGNYATNHEDLLGQVAYYDNTNTYSSTTHGTAVAITAAGGTNNSTGKSSIGYDCALSLVGMNYNKVLELSAQGIRVINMSWASSCYYSQYQQDIITEVYLSLIHI